MSRCPKATQCNNLPTSRRPEVPVPKVPTSHPRALIPQCLRVAKHQPPNVKPSQRHITPMPNHPEQKHANV
eukprot:10701581-Alexandrium_andersonii.AAC.1